jgi:cell wall-associated NlpC family hydrolase
VPAGRPRRSRAVFGALALAALVCVGLLPAAPAAAAPSIEEIEAQLDKQWEQLEPTIEQFNKVRSQLRSNQKKSADLAEKIEPLALQAELSMNKMGRLASRYYKTGPGSDLNALLVTGSASTLTDQLALLDRLARDEQEQIAAVVEARDKYDAEKRKLDDLIEQQRKQDAELAAKKKQIDAEMKRLEQMRLTAAGYTGSGAAQRIGPCPATYIGGPAGVAVRTACAQIGKPYVWGATGPGSFDCSGLTQYAWGKAGVSLTHFTGAQWNQGSTVSRANARPGDLVFFYSDLHHVGMYVGNGIMVHAPRSGKPVQMQHIDVMPIAGFKRVG